MRTDRPRLLAAAGAGGVCLALLCWLLARRRPTRIALPVAAAKLRRVAPYFDGAFGASRWSDGEVDVAFGQICDRLEAGSAAEAIEAAMNDDPAMSWWTAAWLVVTAAESQCRHYQGSTQTYAGSHGL
jgi:hypothetical protein